MAVYLVIVDLADLVTDNISSNTFFFKHKYSFQFKNKETLRQNGNELKFIN